MAWKEEFENGIQNGILTGARKRTKGGEGIRGHGKG